MKIRKTIYTIDFYHFITFKDHYKGIISAYFAHENMQYAIENENTINERIRLYFPNEGFSFQFGKEGATMIYEGDIKDLKKQNTIATIFFEIVDKLKKIVGFTKVKRHKLNVTSVDIYEQSVLDKLIKDQSQFNNPFEGVKEFAVVYEFVENEKYCKLEFGNYSFLDVKKYDITPFSTSHNKDLVIGKVGLMAHVNVVDEIEAYSFTKMKQLIEQSENILTRYMDGKII